MVPVLRPVVNQHESSSGQVIAVVQPHRYTRLSSLFDQFSTCFNDADTVIVAHVYPPAKRRSRVPTRTFWCRACAPAATATSFR